ncbi:MAG: SGNH/GDSL hydrolase family protein [Clostridia bacterium]|nr:SGNH/GDSL hydrolase family protein [Clostridia bacterium]
MKIKDKINLDAKGLAEHGPITIVAFGDSITHGFFRGYVDYDAAYPNLLRRRILEVRDYVPVNVINAGIGGTTARASLSRMEKQVFAHLPDLVIVCFGLNDVNGSSESYLDSLRAIFSECQRRNTDVIFMTPNMLNTRVAEDTPAQYVDYAAKTAQMQNSGRMDAYIESAVALAESMGVAVCDCYAKWKKLAEEQDVTMLLANRINHPTEQMHALFADSLFECIFGDGFSTDKKLDSSMYKEN